MHSSQAVEATDFKFDVRVPRGQGQSAHEPLICSKRVTESQGHAAP